MRRASHTTVFGGKDLCELAAELETALEALEDEALVLTDAEAWHAGASEAAPSASLHLAGGVLGGSEHGMDGPIGP